MKIKLLFMATLALAVSRALADNPTAFELIKRGDQYVGVQSKDKIVQIRSEKSVASLTPNIWYVVYYDPDATFKSVQVKFGAGQELDVTHPWRIIEMADNAHKILDAAKLKIDSDQAQSIATSQPLLKNLTLKATQFWLIHGDNGPEWKVKLWAAKLKNPNDSASVGEVYISADDGSIVQLNLHPNSAD